MINPDILKLEDRMSSGRNRGAVLTGGGLGVLPVSCLTAAVQMVPMWMRLELPHRVVMDQANTQCSLWHRGVRF